VTVDHQNLLISLGPNGDESLAVFLKFMETLSRRQSITIADFNRILRRRGGEAGGPTAIDDVLARVAQGQPGLPLCQTLPELPWIDAHIKPGDEQRPFGFDRAGLAARCWEEWVRRTVHDASVPWYQEIEGALRALHESARQLGADRNRPIHAFVLANLSSPVEGALAFALGRFLRSWHSAELDPVLLAILAPREDVSQVAEFARGRGVAALADILRDWEHLGYGCVSLIDGRLSKSGGAIVRLADHELATVLGQILYASAASGPAHAAMFGGDRRRAATRPDGLITVAAAGYAYDPRQLAHYAAIRLLLSIAEAEGPTDAGLDRKLVNAQWPTPSGASTPADADVSVVLSRDLAHQFENLVTADIAGIVRTLDEIVDRAGYKETLREDFCRTRPIAEWPEVVQDLIAIVQRGVVDPIEPVLRSAAESRCQQLGGQLLRLTKESFRRRDLDDRLLSGTVVLGALRLLERRLPDVCRATSERLQAARQEEASGATDQDREIARLYESLCREAHAPPHPSALGVRAVLWGALVAASFLVCSRSLLGTAVPRLAEAAIWGAVAGASLWGLSYLWLVTLRRISCASTVGDLRRNLELRCGVLLNRMRLSALETYLQSVQAQVRRTVRAEVALANAPSDPPPTETSSDDASAAPSLAGIPTMLRQYAAAWREQVARLNTEAERFERQYQTSAYLSRLPRMPRKEDRRTADSLQTWLDRGVIRLPSRTGTASVGPSERLAVVHQALSHAAQGVWETLMPDALGDLPAALPRYFDALVARLRERLWGAYYDGISIDDLLRELPVDQVRWSAAAQAADVQAELESVRDATRENAKRSVLVEELFNHTVPLLPVAGIHAERFFWLSGSLSQDGDYLLQEPGLKRHVEKDACGFTNDRAASILLGYNHGVKPSDVLQASGSVYRQLLQGLREQHPNHPELAAIPETLIGGTTGEH
jgi:hypothetical protein